MAEYIDRTELAVTPIDITDLPRDKCLMVYLAEDVDSLPTADVIERSEYIESQKEVLRLGDLFHKANQNAMKYEGMYKELHSKINNAIEEIEGEYLTCNQDLIDGVNRALEILKRNIERG